jgi:hypothetical protein
MRYLKRTMLTTTAILALTGFLGAGQASATTLEVGGTAKNESVSVQVSIKSGTSAVLRDTFGFTANTCKGSNLEGTSMSSFTGTRVRGALSSLTFTGCGHSVTVHNPGQFIVEYTSGTNGKVYSEYTEVTVYSTLHGTYISCTTGSFETSTPIGTLTGAAIGNATIDINATLDCSPHQSSAKWTGTYTVISPWGLGVVS